MEPAEIPFGKNNGADFEHDAVWRMYHGDKVPGFPVHPHRGFETVTVMVEGYVDHFDSKGSKGRYGDGDVQWMTAGKGIQHSEMFPVLSMDKENPMELFQFWLNLPQKDKFAEPGYKMLWNEEIPIVNEKDNNGNNIQVRILAGEYKNVKSLDPLPASWAYDRNNHVNIWFIYLDGEARFSIPAISKTLNRMLYNDKGGSILIDGTIIENQYSVHLDGSVDVLIENGDKPTVLLLVEGEPINEPIAMHGPFAMNTIGELKQAYSDYQETEFGGWQWDREDPVNNRKDDRFANYENNKKIEYPTDSNN